MGGGRLLTASEQILHCALPITPCYHDIANCIRANGSLNATDNSIIYYEESN